MIKLGIVTCTKVKLDRAAPAWLMYLPSPAFRAIVQFAMTECDEYIILSAKYGPTEPDTVIVPYNLHADDVGLDDVVAINRRVRDVCSRYDEARYYGGKAYHRFMYGIPSVQALSGSALTRLTEIPTASGPETGTSLPTVESIALAYFNQDKPMSTVRDLLKDRYPNPSTARQQFQRLIKSGYFIEDCGHLRYTKHPIDINRSTYLCLTLTRPTGLSF